MLATIVTNISEYTICFKTKKTRKNGKTFWKKDKWNIISGEMVNALDTLHEAIANGTLIEDLSIVPCSSRRFTSLSKQQEIEFFEQFYEALDRGISFSDLTIDEKLKVISFEKSGNTQWLNGGAKTRLLMLGRKLPKRGGGIGQP